MMLRLIDNPGNRGKGYSVRNGMLSARGRILIFSDADLSSPIEELPKLLDALTHGADIAIGSRWLRAEMQTQRQPLHRQLFGRIFNLMLRVTLGLQYKDTQCGFKLFRRDAARRVFPLQRLDGFSFDVEDLFIARQLGIPTIEVPVRWNNVEGTKVGIAQGIASFLDLLRIRWNWLQGRYAD